MIRKFDAIIIGSGQAGNPLAKDLANAGNKVAMIERRLVGGTCINDGCTPTKTMIASARMAYLAKHSSEWGIDIQGSTVNLDTIHKRKNDVVTSFRNSSQKGLEDADVELIFGEASFLSSKQITVRSDDGTSLDLEAEKIFINTGTRTTIPKIEGLENIPYYTSTSMLELAEIPEHLIIIGGAYIGLEYGQMYRRFGSRVTILDSSDRFLPKEDEDVSENIREFLEQEEITIYTAAKAKKFEREGSVITLSFSVDDKEHKVTGSHVLIAAGRTPNSDVLNLANAGIEVSEKGYIRVNSRLETNVANVFAIGEINGSPAFTHIAYNDFVIVSKNLLEDADLSTENRQIPYCMFTDPQLGRVGMTEKQALEKGFDIEIAKIEMQYVARAIETNEKQGLMKAIVDKKSKQILGAAVIGAEGGEIMSVLQMAMTGGITYEQIRYYIFAHPTYSESLNNLFMRLDTDKK